MEPSGRHWLIALAAAALVHALLALAWILLLPPSGLAASDEQGVVLSLAALGDTSPAAPTMAPTIAPPVMPESVAAAAVTAEEAVAETVPTIQPKSGPQPAVPASAQELQARIASGAPVAPKAADPVAPQVIAPLTIRPETVQAQQLPSDAVAMRTPAPQEQTQARRGDADPNASYVGRLRGWLIRNKHYPRRARELALEGAVRLYFVVDRQGRVLEYKILEGSGHPLLDRAVEQMIEDAQPLPAMPDDLLRNRLELIVPVIFSLE